VLLRVLVVILLALPAHDHVGAVLHGAAPLDDLARVEVAEDLNVMAPTEVGILVLVVDLASLKLHLIK
jgi:hypothetical protein